MSLSHACIAAIVCRVPSPAVFCVQGLSVERKSMLGGAIPSFDGLFFANRLKKRVAQSKTGQMTMRHLTSEFGCGGRI